MKAMQVSKFMATLCTILLLAGCAGKPQEEVQPTSEPFAQIDDDYYVLRAQDVDVPIDGAGEKVCVVFDCAGADGSVFNTALWSGVKIFCDNFGFKAISVTQQEEGEESAQAAFRSAADENAALIVCGGENMAVALYDLQESLAATDFLLLDAEPHNKEYSDYKAAENVHSVLFRVEQAAWLAGYAAVVEGYTQLAIAASGAMPETVRSATGFIQGAEAGARMQGVYVTCRVWYNAVGRTTDEIAQHVTNWYDEGTQVVFALDENILQGSLQAVDHYHEGFLIAGGANQNNTSNKILTTAVRCYSTALQNQLYTYFSSGGVWNHADAGQTVRLGVLENGVALPSTTWRFKNFTQNDYSEQYIAIRDNGVVIEVISDRDVLPATDNVEIVLEES